MRFALGVWVLVRWTAVEARAQVSRLVRQAARVWGKRSLFSVYFDQDRESPPGNQFYVEPVNNTPVD